MPAEKYKILVYSEILWKSIYFTNKNCIV